MATRKKRGWARFDQEDIDGQGPSDGYQTLLQVPRQELGMEYRLVGAK